MVNKILLLFSILLFLGVMPASAQTDIRATVNYPTLNLRDAPNAQSPNHWEGTSNILAVLSQGDVVLVQAVEMIEHYREDYGYLWVYVHVPSLNLSGWVAGDYLAFERADWANHVPHLETWAAVVQYTGVRLPETGIDIQAANFCGQGNAYFPVFTDPINQTLASTITVDTPITAYGRAEIDGKISRYLYIRSQDGQHAGWISLYNTGEVVYTGSCGGPDINYFQALPILYVGSTATRDLHPYGVVEITALNLRDAPSVDGQLLRELPYQTHLTLHNITSYDRDEAWVYVTVATTGESGWVFARYLSYWVMNWQQIARRDDGYMEALPLTEQP